jgi:hypothetical protein
MSGRAMNDNVVESLLSQLGHCGRRRLQLQGFVMRPSGNVYICEGMSDVS